MKNIILLGALSIILMSCASNLENQDKKQKIFYGSEHAYYMNKYR